MAQETYKISLLDTQMPMLPEQQTRSVIGATNRETAGADGYDANRPALAYAENIMPTARGLNSIGYLQAIPPIAELDPGERVLDTRSIYGNAGTRIELTWDSTGKMFALIINADNWIPIPDPTPSIIRPDFSINRITVGTVHRISYIWFIDTGCFIYDEATNTLQNVILTGINIQATAGLAASNGYLLAYTREAIAWSSTLEPTDFTPNEVTGAGGGKVADLKGLILFAVSNDVGVIVYSEANAVAGSYTGNIKYPFKFREIKASKGGATLDKVAYEANAGKQFLYAQAGLQSIDAQRAEIILPEVTDFLAGKRQVTYDANTGVYTYSTLDDTTNFIKKVKLVSSRYLMLSYGIGPAGNNFQYVIVYDIALDKLGKLKIDHADVLELHRKGVEDTRESIGLMLDTGEIKVVDFAVGRASDGILVLGKLQHTRGRFLRLEEVEVENIDTSDSLILESQAALDGKNHTMETGYLAYSDDNIRKYYFNSEALNHSLVLRGDFNAVTVQIKYVVGGRI